MYTELIDSFILQMSMPTQEIEKVLPHSTKVNHHLQVLILVNTLLTFAVGMFAPFYAVFVAKVGGDATMAGLSWALFSIISGILILLFSRLELKIKRRHVLLALGYLLRAVVFLSYAFMDSIAQLLITQVLWGVAAALGTPAFDALYSSNLSKDKSIVEWGNWEGVSSIATGIAAIIGGALIQLVGFQQLFLTMSLITAAIGIFLLYQRYKIKKILMEVKM